jgi:hypothetical protein
MFITFSLLSAYLLNDAYILIISQFLPTITVNLRYEQILQSLHRYLFVGFITYAV